MSAGTKVTVRRVTINPAGAQALLRSPQVTRALEHTANRIGGTAVGYHDRFTAKRGYRTETDAGGTVTVALVGPAAHWDEWGNRYRKPRAPMRRALAQLGLWSRTKESPKP